MVHCEKIRQACKGYGIPCELRVSSAHKGTDETMKILGQYEGRFDIICKELNLHDYSALIQQGHLTEEVYKSGDILNEKLNRKHVNTTFCGSICLTEDTIKIFINYELK